MAATPNIPCPFNPAELVTPLALTYLTGAEVGAAVLLSAAAWDAAIPCTLPSDDGILAAIARMPLDEWAARSARLRDALGIVPVAEGVCELSLLRHLHTRALDEADSRRERTRAATQAAAAKRQRSGERGEPPTSGPGPGPGGPRRGRPMDRPPADPHDGGDGLRYDFRNGERNGDRDGDRRVASGSASDPSCTQSAQRPSAPTSARADRSASEGASGGARDEVVGVVGAGALGAIEELFAREWPLKCEAWVSLMLKRASFPWIQNVRQRSIPPHVIDAAIKAHGQDPELVAYVLRRISDEKTPDAIGWVVKGLGLNDLGKREPWGVALWFNKSFAAVMERTKQDVLAECRARITLMRPPQPPNREVRDGE